MNYKCRILNRSNLILFIVLVVVLFFCIALWYLRISPTLVSDEFVEVGSENGVYDLRDFDFENSIAMMTSHEEFIAGELLTPQEFEMREEEAKVNEPYNSAVTTSRMTYLMPDDGRYIITDRSLDFCERIYINGELIQEVGTVALTAEESVPHHAYLIIEVQPVNGVIEIVRQGNNFVHIGGNIAASLTIGSAEKMHQRISFDYGLSGVVIALFFTMTAMHLLLYTVFQRYISHLYFAALTFVWGFRMGVTGIVLFGEWFPTFSWYFGFRIQQFTWPMASGLIFLITMHLMPKILPKWLIKSYAIICIGYAMSCFFLPTIPISISMLIFQIINVVATGILGISAIICLVRMVISRTVQMEHVLFVVGLLPLVFAILNDTLYDHARSLFDARFEMGDFTMLVFVIFQTTALFYDSGRKNEALYIAEQESRSEANTLRRAGEMKEEFIRTLSHELQIPLTTVSSISQNASNIIKEDGTVDTTMMLDKLRVIDNTAVRLSRMVSQLLDASAMELGTFKLYRETLDTSGLLDKVVTLYFPIMNDGSKTLKVNLEKNLPEIYGDEDRLVHIILNLLSNAIKYSSDGLITLSATHKDDSVEISVSDTGKGIAPELLPDIFARYPKYRSEKGNGLGLYIVAQTVEAHGGVIKIESEKDKGTTVKFTVPIARRNENE